jgi:hypothetical protein
MASPMLSAQARPRGATSELEVQLTIRRAMLSGGVFTLPVAAASQELTAEYAPSAASFAAAAPAAADATAVAVEVHEVETGTLPPPPASLKHKPRGGEYAVDEHLLTASQVAARFQTDVNVADPTKSRGLAREEAARRLKAYGPNRLSPPKQLPEILKFLKQVRARVGRRAGAGPETRRRARPHPTPPPCVPAPPFCTPPRARACQIVGGTRAAGFRPCAGASPNSRAHLLQELEDHVRGPHRRS